MLLDAGILKICRLEEKSEGGSMAKEMLVEVRRHYYGERTIGFSRQYAAKGVNQQVDLLAEIWQDREIRAGMYAVDDTDTQYRIDQVQHKENEDGLRVTWLSLSRLEALYDIAAEA